MSKADEIGQNIEAAFEGVRKLLEQKMYFVMEKLRADAVNIIDENKAVAWGQMRANVLYEVTREAGKIMGVVGTAKNVPYSVFRHEGTKPHWPPIEAIQKWVVQKGLVMSPVNKPTSLRGLRSSKSKGASAALSTTQSVAFLIARKISKMGTTGLPFLRMALDQNMDWIKNEFDSVKI